MSTASHIHRKEFEAALGILNELKETSPDCFEARYLISGVHLEQGDVDQAVVVLEERVFENEDYFDALAHAYLRHENHPKAAEAARNALAKNSKSTEALMTLANSLGFPLVRRKMRREVKVFSLTEAERQQVLEAVQTGETAVVILRVQHRSFQLGEMLTNLSAFYELAGNDENAAKSAREAAEYAPQNITTLTNLWASEMRLGKYAEAYATAGKMINNRMEIFATIAGLEMLKQPCKVTIYSDSKYVVDAMMAGWVAAWKRKSWWRTKDRAPGERGFVAAIGCAVPDASSGIPLGQRPRG